MTTAQPMLLSSFTSFFDAISQYVYAWGSDRVRRIAVFSLLAT
jgi:hypothetical protein